MTNHERILCTNCETPVTDDSCVCAVARSRDEVTGPTTAFSDGIEAAARSHDQVAAKIRNDPASYKHGKILRSAKRASDFHERSAAAIRALAGGAEPAARYRNLVDGKTYTFVAEKDDLVLYRLDGRETLYRLGKSEFAKRFQLLSTAAALSSPLPCPRGWKLIPIEPTIEMRAAWSHGVAEDHAYYFYANYMALLAATPSPPPSSHVRAYPQELTDDLRDILSMMMWATGPIAHALRDGGQDIKRKAEEEQAEVMHWLIGLALEHGFLWRQKASDRIREIRDALATSEGPTDA